MRITESRFSSIGNMNSVEVVKAALEAIAKQHNTSVDQLVEGSIAIGSAGEPYQQRVVNLVKRMEKLRNE